MSKTILLALAATALYTASGASPSGDLSPQQIQAKVEQAEKHAKSLAAEARGVTTKIGELAISGTLTTDVAAINELKRLVAVLEQINARLAVLEESISGIKAWASGKEVEDAKVATALGDIDKIHFSNYVQFQFRDTDQSSKEQHSFEVRRAKISMTMDVNEQSSLKLSFSVASGADRSDAELSDAILYYKPAGAKGLRLAAGQMPTPIGYEIERSSSRREFPERSAYNRQMFNGERVRGFMVEQALEGGFTGYAGVSNALTVKDKEQAGLAPGTGGKLAGFGGLRFQQGPYTLGAGYYAGTRPAFTSTSGTSPEVDRRFFYLDAQVEDVLTKGLYVRGEAMLGRDRLPSSSGGPLKTATDMDGYHAVFGYHIDDENELFTRYSVFDADTDSDGNAMRDYGFGYRRILGSGVSLTLTYELFEDPTSSDSLYPVTTLRAQFKF